MSGSTRRGFLKIAGAGAAVGAAVTAAAVSRSGGDRAAAGSGAAPAAAGSAAGSGALVAYVRDVRGAEVSVLVGETEVVVRDRDLVARLAAARTAGTA